ncbi:MAG: shikimate dehydrogenase [Pseudomonadota bacterium]
MSDDQTAILDRYGVIGYPVAQSRSPFIHRLFADQTDQAMTYELIEAPEDKLDTIVRHFQRNGGRGLNVTVPHKTAITRLVDELSEEASIAGAVNTLELKSDRIVGHNTDGLGLVRDLTHHWQYDVGGKRILLLGAGGAAQGIVAPLLELEPEQLVIANRSIGKADALANHFGTLGAVRAIRFSDIRESDDPYDLIINATSIGLTDEKMPFPHIAITPRHSDCYDLGYGLSETPFMRWAATHDAARIRSGWGMLIEQAAESFRIWRGVTPDTKDVIKRLPIN